MADNSSGGEWTPMHALRETGLPVYDVGNAKSYLSNIRHLNQLGIPSLLLDEESFDDQPTISFGLNTIKKLLSEQFIFGKIEELDYTGKPYIDDETGEVTGASEGYSYLIKEIRVYGAGNTKEVAQKDLINNTKKYIRDYFNPDNISFFTHVKNGSAHHYGWLLRIAVETGLEDNKIKELLGL